MERLGGVRSANCLQACVRVYDCRGGVACEEDVEGGYGASAADAGCVRRKRVLVLKRGTERCAWNGGFLLPVGLLTSIIPKLFVV